jgi:hypothetical protein
MEHTIIYVGLEVLTAVAMKSSIFWDITPRSPLKVNNRFGRTCRLHLQDRRISQARNQPGLCLPLALTKVSFAWLIFFDPEDGDMFPRNVG